MWVLSFTSAETCDQEHCTLLTDSLPSNQSYYGLASHSHYLPITVLPMSVLFRETMHIFCFDITSWIRTWSRVLLLRNIEFWTWINNCMHIKQWHAIIHPHREITPTGLCGPRFHVPLQIFPPQGRGRSLAIFNVTLLILVLEIPFNF